MDPKDLRVLFMSPTTWRTLRDALVMGGRMHLPAVPSRTLSMYDVTGIEIVTLDGIPVGEVIPGDADDLREVRELRAAHADPVPALLLLAADARGRVHREWVDALVNPAASSPPTPAELPPSRRSR